MPPLSGLRFYLLITCLQAAIFTPNHCYAGKLPEEFIADYTVYKGIVTLAKTRRILKKSSENQYEFQSITKPSGVGKIISTGEINEKSIWKYHDHTTRPTEYTYINSGSKHKRDVTLIFDWKNATVTNIINGDPWKMDLIPEIQDKLLYQLTLMLDLSKGKKHLEYSIADGGTLKTYKAFIMEKKVLETEIGKFETVKVVRHHDDGRSTIFWCAPKLMYIPLRIEQIKQDGSSVRAEIDALTGIPLIPAQNSPVQLNPAKKTK